MDYELFKKVVAEGLGAFLHEPYKSYRLEVNRVKKVNQTIDALQMIPNTEGKGSVVVGPSMNLHELYEYYLQEEDLNQVLRQTARSMEASYALLDRQMVFPDPETMRKNVIATVINTQKNEALLAEAPHLNVMDLSIVFRWVMKRHEDGLYVTTITYEMLKRMKMTEEELAEVAWANTKANFPCSWKRWLGSKMHIVTNEMNLNGAIGLFCTELLSEIAEELQDDLYIIPSSIHEVMASAKSVQDLKVLRKALREGNETVVERGDVLSTNIYIFERESKKLRIAE